MERWKKDLDPIYEHLDLIWFQWFFLVCCGHIELFILVSINLSFQKKIIHFKIKITQENEYDGLPGEVEYDIDLTDQEDSETNLGSEDSNSQG